MEHVQSGVKLALPLTPETSQNAVGTHDKQFGVGTSMM